MLKKEAQPANWQKILSGLKRIKNLPPKVREYVNDPSRIKFPQKAENSQAVAYVTNEDYDNDGRNDSLKVHIVVPTFNSAFRTSDLASMAEDSPEFKDAIERIADVLVHEIVGHINDFDPNDSENPFKGGEAVAEAAERNFKPVWASTINNNLKEDSISKISYNGDFKMKTDLVKLANHLDSIGHTDLADRLDIIVRAEMGGGMTGYVQDQAMTPTSTEGTEMEAGMTSSIAPMSIPVDETQDSTQAALAKAEENERNGRRWNDGLTQEEIDLVNESSREDTDADAADAANAMAEKMTLSSEETENRISKMAKLISGEFTLNSGLLRR